MNLSCLPAQWPAPAGVTALTTLRHGAGVSAPPFDHFNLGGQDDDPASIARNRAELGVRCALPSAPCWLRQVHGVEVLRFDAPPAQDTAPPEADAAITAQRGVVLAILSADCLPVVFAAGDGHEVAAAHAGWRGLAAGVLERTVAAMDTPAHALLAWLGPAAGPSMYEVGDEVRAAFCEHAPEAAAAFAPTRRGHWRVDLYRLARQRLREAGVEDNQIFGGQLCTLSDPHRFFSHRRDALTGRMATLVWRE